MVKNGFSLAEALVVMAIISIFFAFASKVITTKPKAIKQDTPHGYFECYRNGSTGPLMQNYVYEVVIKEPEEVSACKFKPPVGAAFFNINVYGRFYSAFEPNITNEISITVAPHTGYIQMTVDGSAVSLPSNSSSADYEQLKERIKVFLESKYPESGLYNNGSFNNGIMISW